MTGQQVLAQSGLKATLQALCAEVLDSNPGSTRRQGDYSARLQPLAGLCGRSKIFVSAVGHGYIRICLLFY